MTCKVSVIIPVFNASKCIGKLLDSLLSQTLQDIEYIFIDDASTDNSLDILYAFETRDPERIIVIESDKNQGPGGARNLGLQYASGAYIGFADSDDYLSPNMFECLYQKAIEGDYDLVESSYYNERKNMDMRLWDKSIEGEVTFDSRIRMFLSCGFLWSKLYKRDIILNDFIDFIPKIQFEDVDFLSRVYCRINKVGIVDDVLYYYHDNPDSLTNKGNPHQLFEVNHQFSQLYLKHLSQEKHYMLLKPVIEYVVLGVWFDLFRQYAQTYSDTDTLCIFSQEIQKHISNYHENIFFIEQAKKDDMKRAFLVNAYDSDQASLIIKAMIK